METTVAKNEQAPSEPRPEAGFTAPTVNIPQLLWGQKWLILLGVVAGLGGGYLYFTKQPPQFRSSARIQVVEPFSKAIPVEGLDTLDQSVRSLADEAMVMRSKKIMTSAAALGKLSDLNSFRGRDDESIGRTLGATSALSINLAGQSGKSSIFDLSYTAGDPVTTKRVVDATIDAYAEHLRMQHKNVGQETLKLIEQARAELEGQIRELEDDYQKYREDSPLIFRGGTSTSVHRELADKFLTQKQELIVQKTQLDSMLSSAKKALQAGQPKEAVLLALEGASPSSILKLANQSAEGQAERLGEEFELSASERMRRDRLLPLKLEEEQYLENYGEKHPMVRAVRNKISMVETVIQRLETDEAEYKKRMEEALASYREANKDNREQTPEQAVEDQIRLTVLALQQRQRQIAQELEVISEAYEAEMKAARSEGQAEMDIARFEREIARQNALYERIVARLDEMNIVADTEGLRIEVLDPPVEGGKIGPSAPRSLGLGGFLGFAIAAGLAYLIEVSDRSYHSAEQIAEHLSLPVIGHVPTVDAKKMKANMPESNLDGSLCTFLKGKSRQAEAFKAIRTALYFSNQGGNLKVLQVTSATPSDGKSTVAGNIAISVAQSGKNVLLIDADLRRPRVEKLFGMESERGLAWLLETLPRHATKNDVYEMLGEALQESEVPNLSVMGAGQRPDNPAELLSSSDFDLMLDALRDKFDMIVIDTPPLLAVTDPSNVAPRVDGVIMVVRLKKNVKPLAAQAARILETLGAKTIGVVVNGVGGRKARGYGKYGEKDGYYNRGYYYKYGYGYSYGSGYGYGYDKKYNEYYEDEPKKRRRDRQKVDA